MQRKPFNNELEDLLYDKSKYDPYALDKTLNKIAEDSTWDELPEIEEKDTGPISFEEDYLRRQKAESGYDFSRDSMRTKESSLSLYSKEGSYSYEDGALMKIKKIWDNKSFWYKFFIIDLVIGVLVEILLHSQTA